ncbi:MULTISPECIES: YitT family protein [Paenibacillus]|uniref:YitT family protein n=1 Tax=Paenibacillus radicis (ex Xue et al. 2023) TaxID=2972489 RepID=A0ABT1YMT6_9BACL|nr:YitT family protein [Paenibacillus radicis (ex Xue et al. 2023)]MCR8634493.1 YitT family protein [Paenibacillus radicis (ex Xue et al. 2023)]
MSTKHSVERLHALLPILLGTAIYAFGLHYFVISNELMEGGITGIALLLNYIFQFPPSISTLVINVPLFAIGWKFLGKEAMYYSIVGTVSLSFFLWIMEWLIQHSWIVPFRTEHDYFLATAYAGLTLGIGLGLVFRYGGTTGGSDIIARIGQKWKGWSMGQVILLFDGLVIGTAFFFIPKEKILYTLVAVFITTKVIDIIIEGAYAARSFTIITDHAEELVTMISEQTDRGATIIPAIGGYSKQNKNVVYCVVYRQEMKRLKDLTRSIDPHAFIIINEVHDVLGEGFKPE